MTGSSSKRRRKIGQRNGLLASKPLERFPGLLISFPGREWKRGLHSLRPIEPHKPPRTRLCSIPFSGCGSDFLLAATELPLSSQSPHGEKCNQSSIRNLTVEEAALGPFSCSRSGRADRRLFAVKPILFVGQCKPCRFHAFVSLVGWLVLGHFCQVGAILRVFPKHV